MRKAYVEFEVDDTFEKDNCYDCPLGVWDDYEDGYVCASVYYDKECPINIREQEGSGVVE